MSQGKNRRHCTELYLPNEKEGTVLRLKLNKKGSLLYCKGTILAATQKKTGYR